jgi:hypothetical protein
MALMMKCPNGHELSVAEQHAGKRVMCPMCRAVLDVPAGRGAGAPPPLPPATVPQGSVQARRPEPKEEFGDVTFEEDDRPRRKRPQADWEEEDEQDRPRKRRARRAEDYDEDFEDDRPRKTGGMKRRQRMKLVNLGLGFHYAGLVIVLVGLVVSILMPLLMFTGIGLLLSVALNYLFLIAYGLVIPGLWITGSVLCLYVPPKSGGYPLILASVILNGVALVLLLILWVVLGPLALLGVFASFAAWICFMLFLRAFASYLREHGCADEAMQLLILGIGLIVAMVLFGVLLFLMAVSMQAPFWILVILSLGGGITLLVFEVKFLIRNLQLIGSLRQAIATRG